MKSYSAFYVRTENPEKARQRFRSVEPVAGSPWWLCDFRMAAAPPNDDVLWGNAALAVPPSRLAGEVLFLFGDVPTGGFVFEHARDGALLRKLVWYPLLDDDWTPGWLCAQGEPEAWEAALFRDDQLDAVLEAERSRLENDPGAWAVTERELRRSWEARRIQAGKTYPPADGTVAQLVERSYGIRRP